MFQSMVLWVSCGCCSFDSDRRYAGVCCWGPAAADAGVCCRVLAGIQSCFSNLSRSFLPNLFGIWCFSPHVGFCASASSICDEVGSGI